MGHENLRREEAVEGSSDRTFGWVFAGVFAAIGAWPMIHGASPRWWSVAIGVAFALVALAFPRLLGPANRLWMRLGLAIGRVVSPVATAALFFGVFLPIGLLVRLTKHDLLRLRREPGARTYWIDRTPPGPPPDSLTNQF